MTEIMTNDRFNPGYESAQERTDSTLAKRDIDFKYQFTKQPVKTDNNEKNFIGISQKHSGPNCELIETLKNSGAGEAEEPAPGISAEEQFQAFRPAGKPKTLKSLVDAEKTPPVGYWKTAFDGVLESRTVKIREILSTKFGESKSVLNKFHVFKVAAQMENKTPEQALYGMMLKHMADVKDLIDFTSYAPEWITRESIDLMIGENINHLILLEGLLLERIDGREHKTTLTAGLE